MCAPARSRRPRIRAPVSRSCATAPGCALFAPGSSAQTTAPPASSARAAVSVVGEPVLLPGVSGRRSTLRPAGTRPLCTLG